MRRGFWMFRSSIVGLLVMSSLQHFLHQEKTVAQETLIPPVVAKVNGKPITAQVFLRLWRQVELEMGGLAGSKDPEKMASQKREVLDRLITLELLNQRADELKIQLEPGEIETELRGVESRYGTKEDLDKVLATRGLTRTDLMADLRTSQRIRRLLSAEVLDKVSVEPEEVKSFYEANPKAFEVPEQIRARHIVIRVDADATGAERKEARRAIVKAAKRIQNGEPFDKVAKEVSQDRSASRGGDMGYFNRGQTPPEFERVAFALEAGQVSEMVETLTGFHLIKLEEKHPPRTIPFHEAESQISAYLKAKKQEAALKRYVKDLRQVAKIEKADMFNE